MHSSAYDENYGLSQNPDTGVYILVFDKYYLDSYCEICGSTYVDYWCKSCQINNLRNNFPNWTSGNVKLDDFIQKMQLKINDSNNVIFEWIPYNELTDIKKIGNGNTYSAIWNDGPLYYSNVRRKYKRKLNEKVLLKYLYNSQSINNTSLNEV
jgi:hypothetical protein